MHADYKAQQNQIEQGYKSKVSLGTQRISS